MILSIVKSEQTTSLLQELKKSSYIPDWYSFMVEIYSGSFCNWKTNVRKSNFHLYSVYFESNQEVGQFVEEKQRNMISRVHDLLTIAKH